MLSQTLLAFSKSINKNYIAIKKYLLIYLDLTILCFDFCFLFAMQIRMTQDLEILVRFQRASILLYNLWLSVLPSLKMNYVLLINLLIYFWILLHLEYFNFLIYLQWKMFILIDLMGQYWFHLPLLYQGQTRKMELWVFLILQVKAYFFLLFALNGILLAILWKADHLYLYINLSTHF